MSVRLTLRFRTLPFALALSATAGHAQSTSEVLAAQLTLMALRSIAANPDSALPSNAAFWYLGARLAPDSIAHVLGRLQKPVECEGMTFDSILTVACHPPTAPSAVRMEQANMINQWEAGITRDCLSYGNGPLLLVRTPYERIVVPASVVFLWLRSYTILVRSLTFSSVAAASHEDGTCTDLDINDPAFIRQAG
jgi:hypothetical protein